MLKDLKKKREKNSWFVGDLNPGLLRDRQVVLPLYQVALHIKCTIFEHLQMQVWSIFMHEALEGSNKCETFTWLRNSG